MREGAEWKQANKNLLKSTRDNSFEEQPKVKETSWSGTGHVWADVIHIGIEEISWENRYWWSDDTVVSKWQYLALGDGGGGLGLQTLL